MKRLFQLILPTVPESFGRLIRQFGARSSPQRSPGLRRSNEDGFAILLVMLFITLGSVLALSLSMQGVSEHEQATAAAKSTRLQLLLDSALDRALFAIVTPSDPLIVSMREGTANWTYDGSAIRIELQPESGKVDLNAADPNFVSAVLRNTVSDSPVEQIAEQTFLSRRSQAQPISDAALLLPSPDRVRYAKTLRDSFTTFTGQSGIAPLLAPLTVLQAIPNLTPSDLTSIIEAKTKHTSINLGNVSRHLGRLLSSELPIYRLNVYTSDSQHGMGRSEIVSINQNTGAPTIFDLQDFVR